MLSVYQKATKESVGKCRGEWASKDFLASRPKMPYNIQKQKEREVLGKEIEIKLAAPDQETLRRVMEDPAGVSARRTDWRSIDMETDYLDTPARALSAQKWMLRRRLENGETVYTMKTPGDGYTRGEWESKKPTLPEAVAELVRLGAPAALAALTAGGVSRVCGVRFRRETARLDLPGGTACFLCADSGQLLGVRRRPFHEVELELISGPVEPMVAFARTLCADQGLREEPRSKFVRAAELAESPAFPGSRVVFSTLT